MLGTAAAHLREKLLGNAPNKTMVPLCVDGDAYLVIVSLDERELTRREGLALGTASSMGLLQALWELPLGLPFPCSSLDERHADVLQRHGSGWVERLRDHFTRTYEPIGVVTDVAVVSRSFVEALRRVGARTPTSRRVAVLVDPRRHPSDQDLQSAGEQGIGVIEIARGVPRVLVEPAPAVTGRPAVFRWWQAELAYRNLIVNGRPTALAVD